MDIRQNLHPLTLEKWIFRTDQPVVDEDGIHFVEMTLT